MQAVLLMIALSLEGCPPSANSSFNIWKSCFRFASAWLKGEVGHTASLGTHGRAPSQDTFWQEKKGRGVVQVHLEPWSSHAALCHD